MARPIKFRAWDGDGMFYGGFSIHATGDVLDDMIEAQSVMQFTGLTDKNGKDLYEGDIIHYVYNPEDSPLIYDDNYEISWEETGFYMRQVQRCGLAAWFNSIPGMYLACNPNSLFEIIGNIHENSELIK
jgi:uncharacterized phage protein (TIGR01671 family)